MPYTVPHVPRVAPPATEQEQYNAGRALTAQAFTAYVKAYGHPQTLTAPTLAEAALLGLIMHRDCAAETQTGLPVIYALPADGGPGVLIPAEGWLPATLAGLEAASGGAYTPHPDIAAAVAAMARTGARKAGLAS